MIDNQKQIVYELLTFPANILRLFHILQLQSVIIDLQTRDTSLEGSHTILQCSNADGKLRGNVVPANIQLLHQLSIFEQAGLTSLIFICRCDVIPLAVLQTLCCQIVNQEEGSLHKSHGQDRVAFLCSFPLAHLHSTAGYLVGEELSFVAFWENVHHDGDVLGGV